MRNNQTMPVPCLRANGTFADETLHVKAPCALRPPHMRAGHTFSLKMLHEGQRAVD